MIWPGRRLAVAATLPTLLALALLVAEGLRPLVIAVDLAIALAALADLFTLIGAGRLRASRRCGAIASLGQPESVELTVENLGRLPRRVRLRDDVPPTFDARPAEFEASIPARGLVVLPYEFSAGRRGTYILHRVDVLASSRFGLWRRAVRCPARSEVRVYPDVRQIARYTLLARRGKLAAIGVRRTRRIGSDDEFERLRDYTLGDEPRHLDWRATARRQKLTVRAHQATQSQRIIFLIDCGRMMAGDTGRGLSPLDHAFNAMLMLSHVALSRGDQVGLLAFSDRVRAFVPPGGGVHRAGRLVHAVHDVFPELVEPRYDRAFAELERRCRKRSLVILISNLFDDVNAAILGDHLGRSVGRHLPLGVFLRDADIFALADSPPDSGPGLYRSAAAAAMLTWREQALISLRARGVLTLDVAPDDLTAPLVNQYLLIKARHLL